MSLINLGKTIFLLIAMTGRWGHTSGTATVAGNCVLYPSSSCGGACSASLPSPCFVLKYLHELTNRFSKANNAFFRFSRKNSPFLKFIANGSLKNLEAGKFEVRSVCRNRFILGEKRETVKILALLAIADSCMVVPEM